LYSEVGKMRSGDYTVHVYVQQAKQLKIDHK
jgi:hypothetical protein